MLGGLLPMLVMALPAAIRVVHHIPTDQARMVYAGGSWPVRAQMLVTTAHSAGR